MRNEKGSITLFVLVSMLFFLIIATTAYVSASSKLKGQNEELAQIKASYEQDLGDEELLQLYNKVSKTKEWLAGSGTQEDTYKIYTIEDLLTFSRKSNAGEFVDEGTGEARYIYVELMNDLDFKRDSSYAKATRTDFGDINEDGTVDTLKTELTTGQGFPCIAATEANAFTGTFMGNDHEIKNLYILNRKNNVTSIGLFSWFGNSTIEHLGITGNITATVAGTAGGIAGTTVADSTCNINNCYNKSTVTGLTNVAGIVGRANGMTQIKNCYNDGNITSTAENVENYNVYISGIIGCSYNNAAINTCYNTGDIESKITRATDATICNGGIAGILQNGIVDKCYNTGRIIEGNRVGGIIGIACGNEESVKNLKILNSYNTGSINAIALNENNTNKQDWKGRAGGIISAGWYDSLTMINCYNLGDVSAYHSAGGIMESFKYGSCSIINCFNKAAIFSHESISAGIIGLANTAESYNITNCYYTDNSISGIIGITPDPSTQMTQSQMQSSSFVDILNANKNSINLSDYGLSDYTLSSWKQGENGYPEFDW